LNSLVRTSEALAVGDVQQKIDVTSNDEIGRLAASQSRVIDYMREMSGIAPRLLMGTWSWRQTALREGRLGNAFN
jgi:hypothetical protein